MGLSVYGNRSDAIECAREYENLGDKIAEIPLSDTSGQILFTGGRFESHYTWWTFERFDPSAHAKVVHII